MSAPGHRLSLFALTLDEDGQPPGGGGDGAPTDGTYLVTTAHGDLSAEEVVGTTPNGELGGTWAAITVDATHSGSTHAATQSAAESTAAAALSGHAAAADPHAGYLKETDVQGAAGASAFGDSAAAGSGATASRTDHRHSREANPVTAHEAAGDPHTGYRLESADHSHVSTGLQGGLLTDAALSGTPGGELGGTWTSPTVDATHSGSSHAGVISTHEAAGDPHPGYLTTAEGNAAYQPVDSDLTAIAALTTTSFGRGLLALADAAALAANHSHGGGGGTSYTAFTQDLGRSQRAGTFTITGLSGLTAGKVVSVVQTAAAVASKGNATDEPELDLIVLTGTVVDATTIRAYWNAPSVVVGTYAFAYAVSS